jgi:DNA-binding CsgD family transcriptional regulator
MSKKISVEIDEIFSSRSFAEQTFLEMKEMCASPLAKLDCSAFEYARVHDDGTASILYSDASIANYVVSKEVPISVHVPKEIIDAEFWFLPASNGPYLPYISEIKQLSNSCGFVNYIRRHVGFYEMFCFLTPDDQSIASNKFMNMKEDLEQYSLNFCAQAKNLISLVDQHRFKLTDSMLPNFRGLDSNSKTNLNLLFYLERIQQELIKLNMYLSPKLSEKELKCVGFLIEGKTATDIADSLHLSHRTVEMHINSIKAKLDCRKKSDIVGTLINLAEKNKK